MLYTLPTCPVSELLLNAGIPHTPVFNGLVYVDYEFVKDLPSGLQKTIVNHHNAKGAIVSFK